MAGAQFVANDGSTISNNISALLCAVGKREVWCDSKDANLARAAGEKDDDGGHMDPRDCKVSRSVHAHLPPWSHIVAISRSIARLVP